MKADNGLNSFAGLVLLKKAITNFEQTKRHCSIFQSIEVQPIIKAEEDSVFEGSL